MGALLLALVLTCGIQTATAKDIGVVLNGKPISFDTAPCLDNGRVLVPMRGILESLGYTVEWQNDTRSVLASNSETRILMPLGSKTVTVNNKSVSVDAPAKLVSGRTLVPLRFLAEYSGAEVVWNNAEKTVNITSEEIISVVIPAEKTIRDSMVHINNGTKKGAGLILSEDGVIATSYNFIKKSTALELTFNYGQKYNGPVKIVGMDAEKDVVLLKVEKDGLYPIKTTTKYKEGAMLYSLGLHLFSDLARDAGAKRRIGSRILVNVEVLDKYIEYENTAAVTYADYLDINTLNASSVIFISRKADNQPISRTQAFRIVKKAAAAAGIDEVIACHSMRKTFGYQACKQGIPPAILMNIYNHSSYQITKRYLDIDQDDRDETFINVTLK